MATNQEKLDKIYDTILVLQEISKKGSMDALNWKVKDAVGEDKSIFDLVRDGGGIFRNVPWRGFEGQVPPEGQRRTTNAATDLGWADTREASQARQILELQELVKALAVSTGAVIDYDEIARRVNDEQDRRERERLDETKNS